MAKPKEKKSQYVDYCDECQADVESYRWRTTIRDGKLFRQCSKHFESTVTMAQKINSLSPQEVLSGVQYGNKNQYNGSDNNWSQESSEQTSYLKEVLK